MAPAAPTKLIFSSSIEALLKVSTGKVSPEIARALGEMKLGPPHKTLPAYPAEDWARAVKLVSADLWPKLQPDEQHRQLGRATVLQFADTLMGKAMFAAARVIGARRSLERMTHNLRTGANFIETRFTVLDDSHQELWINDVTDVPGFYAGLIGAGADYMQGWSDRIEIKSREGAACTYLLTRTR
ncbi:MAG: DUF2378 family protein [Myxococcaceae bacterium]